MGSIITELFGAYTPLIDSAGNVLEGFAGVNWHWLAGFALGFLVIATLCKAFLCFLKWVMK